MNEEKDSREPQTIENVFRRSDFRVNVSDSMREVAAQLAENDEVVPVFDYSNKYIGGLTLMDFVRFQIAYFRNLEEEDRGPEFVMDNTDSREIRFVPIDEVSRYVNRAIQPVGYDENIDYVTRLLCEQGVNALPVFDENNRIVGTISLMDIANYRRDGEEEPCSTRLSRGRPIAENDLEFY